MHREMKVFVTHINSKYVNMRERLNEVKRGEEDEDRNEINRRQATRCLPPSFHD